MPHTSRIKTPLKQHFNRFRLSVLPAIWFIFCVAVTLYLWQRIARVGSIVGEVAAEQLLLPAGLDGLLVGDPATGVKLFDTVRKGDVIATLDGSELRAQLGAIQAEAAVLAAELESERVSSQVDQLTLLADHERDRLRLVWEVERRHIEVLKLKVEVEGLRQELQGADAALKELRDLAASGFAQLSPIDIADREMERNAAKARLDASIVQGKEAAEQLKAAIKQRDAFGELNMPAMDAALAPIQAGITVQERLMEEVQAQLAKLVITSPIDGVITEIFKVPGQRVVANEPIVTVARPDSEYVISYVRERQNIPLVPGMQVGLRLRGEPGGTEYPSKVAAVGPQVTQVPLHQAFDQTKSSSNGQSLEWATPIKIEIPPALLAQKLRPGPLGQAIFHDPDPP